MNWWKNLPGKVKFQELLKNHTTFKIGGPAEFFIQPKDIDALKQLLRSVKRYHLPLRVIGGGSNILSSDKGLKGVVIKLNSAGFKRIIFKRTNLSAGSAVPLSQVLKITQRRGLSGLEFLAGIPGTVGGALVMNAGAQGASIGNFVKEARVMDYNGKIKTLNKSKLKFGYRTSNLSKYIILNASFNLLKKDRQLILEKITRYLNYRKATQDLSKPSAGCIFKNPDGVSAGKLIDLCALKGKSIGGAKISLRHANFILNQGGACASDVLKLIDLIRKKVKAKFNIALKPEIKIWK